MTFSCRQTDLSSRFTYDNKTLCQIKLKAISAYT